MIKFWNFTENEPVNGGESPGRTLRLNGEIASETWWGDEITPAAFLSELENGEGDLTVYINSPGGDVFAASQIYTMLFDYKGKVTVKIDGMAASAASVIAMSGEEVIMSPTAAIMIHNPATIAIGDSEEMVKAKAMLDEIKESIINAYEIKTGQSRAKISHWMDAETWMNAKKAVELGFADKILGENGDETTNDIKAYAFSRAAVTNSLLAKIPKANPVPPKPTGTPAKDLENRLNLIIH